MSGKTFGVLFCCLAFILVLGPLPGIAATPETGNTPNEIGQPAPMDKDQSGTAYDYPLDDLGAEFAVSLGYSLLTGNGIKETYTGMPLLGLGVSAQVASDIRTFIRIDYSSTSADPYSNVPGFDAPHDTTIKSVPMTFGLRFNISQNQMLRLQIGIGMQAAWQQEETIEILHGGNVSIRESSGFNYGFVGSFGPELVLGEKENILGLEFSFGGSKGEVHEHGYGHNIDLTGFTTRAYYAFAL